MTFRKFFYVPLISLTISTAFANPPNFSPYADITLNTHWDSQTQDMVPEDLTQISKVSGVKSYHLAFITDANACNPAWGAQSTYSVDKNWGQALTKKLNENKIDFIISFGGASGNDLSKFCTEEKLLAVYEQVLKTYQPSGLDFDIENGTADIEKTMRAIEKLQIAHPNLKISFTLPTLPSGLVQEGKELVKKAHDHNLKFNVNIMAMDYGPAFVNDMGEYAIQAATNLHFYLQTLYLTKTNSEIWNLIEVTPMIGVNDVSVEQFTLRNVDTLRNFAAQNQLDGLSMWSIARDKPCADKWASPICSGNNLQTQSYEFAKRFLNTPQ